jgi:hypothetical protein
MGIKESPNRVVRTKDSVIAFIGHNQEANEDILIECFVDSASNKVSWQSGSKAEKGVNFVEADEDVAVLRDATNKLIGQQVEAGQGIPGVQPGHSVFNPGHVVNADQPKWQTVLKADGTHYTSKSEWKAAGSPQE